MAEDSFITTRELAEGAGMDASHIRHLCREGRLKASKPGGRDWLIPHEEAQRWLRDRDEACHHGPQDGQEELLAKEMSPAVVTDTLAELRTKLHEAEAEVDRLTGLLRRTSAHVLHLVHELRAPAASIQTCLDVLLQGYSTIPTFEQEEILRMARDRARAMLSLVNDLLHLGGIQHAQTEREAVPVQLVDALWRIVPEMRIKATLRGIDLHLDVPAKLPPIAAADEHMEQLLHNLIDNAIKYTDPGGRVAVRLREEADCVIGEVEDTGIGMAPEDVGHIFEEFYRARNAREVEPYGTGLGLAIVKRVVELYGGCLQIASELSKGSTFLFKFPKSELTNRT